MSTKIPQVGSTGALPAYQPSGATVPTESSASGASVSGLPVAQVLTKKKVRFKDEEESLFTEVPSDEEMEQLPRVSLNQQKVAEVPSGSSRKSYFSWLEKTDDSHSQLTNIPDGVPLPENLVVPDNMLLKSRGRIEGSEDGTTAATAITNSASQGNATSLHEKEQILASKVASITSLLQKEELASDAEAFLTSLDNKQWAEVAHCSEVYCDHLLNSNTKFDFSTIPTFEEKFLNLVIALLEYYHAKQTRAAVFCIRRKIYQESSEHDLSQDPRINEELADITDSLDEGLATIQRAFASFKKIINSKIDHEFVHSGKSYQEREAKLREVDQRYNFDALNRSVELIVSREVLQKNLEAIQEKHSQKKIAENRAITNESGDRTWSEWFWGRANDPATSAIDLNRTQNTKTVLETTITAKIVEKLLEKKTKIDEAQARYQTWGQYLGLFSQSTDITAPQIVFPKIKELANAIKAEYRFGSLEDKKTLDSFEALNKLKTDSNPAAYDQTIEDLKRKYPQQPQVQKLDSIVSQLSSEAATQGTIIQAGANGLEVRKPKSFFEGFRNAFWLNGFSFFASYHEYEPNRKAILDVRKKVYEQYGSTAVKRFDYHFGYRYRLGAPLTTTALSKFLNHEKYLNNQNEIITINSDELYTDSTPISIESKLLEKITNLASVEFEKCYGPITDEKEKIFLYDHFLAQFIKRPLDIVKDNYNPAIAESGFFASIGARFNAIYVSLFAGNNKNENQKTIKLMEDLLVSRAKINSEEVEGIIKEKLKAKKNARQSQVLTFQDVCLIATEIAELRKKHDTIYNRWVRPVVRFFGNVIAATGVIATTATANDPLMGFITATGASVAAAAMNPEQRLLLGLGLLYTAKGKSVNTTEASWFSTASKTAVNIGMNIATGGIYSLL